MLFFNIETRTIAEGDRLERDGLYEREREWERERELSSLPPFYSEIYIKIWNSLRRMAERGGG